MRPEDIIQSVQLQLRFHIEPQDVAILDELGGGSDKPKLYSYKPDYDTVFLDVILTTPGCAYALDKRLVALLLKSKNIHNKLPIPNIVASEWGGYKPEEAYGKAQVVCGLSGKAIKPFYIGDSPDKKHAVFTIPYHVCLCIAEVHTDSRMQLSVVDVRFDLLDEMSVVQVVVDKHWAGSRFNETSHRYRVPLGLALAKAVTPHCAGPAYIPDRPERAEKV